MHSLSAGVFIFFVEKCHQEKPVVLLPFPAVSFWTALMSNYINILNLYFFA